MRIAWTLIVAAACAHAPRPRACGQGWGPLTDTHAPTGSRPIAHRPDATEVIESVRIEGVTPELATTLASALATRTGMTFGEAPIKEDLKRLWSLGVASDVQVEANAGAVAFVVMPQPRIHTVQVHAPERDAVRRFALLPGTAFEPRRLWRMANALTEEYVRDGHLDAKVLVAQSPTGPDVDVCVVAKPGPRVTVGSLTFPGRRGVPESALRKVMHTDKVNRPGKLFDADMLQLDVLYVAAEYWDRGYANVKVGDPKFARHGAKLAIEVPIVEGDVFHLSAVRITGARMPKLSVRAGDLFSRSKIAEARDQIEKLVGVTVYPITKIDAERRTIDLTFEPQWSWPWDPLVRALSSH